MANNLVIVESPSKAKTIQKFLGADYKVLSSKGHIRDLHKHDFSIDIDNNFAPIYEIPDDKKEVVRALRKEAKAAQTVWLASDEDREGEAIAWHLYQTLGLTPDNSRRIVFHEITKPAILAAIASPRGIDEALVDAQQARRVLDRIVGFELSPVLWKKIKPSLSAGRVQSVAVRLIVDREREIENFKSERFFRVTAQFAAAQGAARFGAELSRRLANADEARACLSDCAGAAFTVGDVTVKPVKKSPAPPFTTSTLQQEAARKLGFTVAQTMRVAQTLYENGLITYMRTDSVNLSSLALGAIKQEISATLGPQYLHLRHWHTASKGAQEAHEAIRPTYIANHEIKGTQQEQKLYNLIWKRTVASQMADAALERTTATIAISTRQDHFTASGETVQFDGFLRLYIESTDDEAGDSDTLRILPALTPGQTLTPADAITATERFTQPPYRYTEASLVKKLEELGIGRPSTYAPTISTIQQRQYVEKGDKPGTRRPCTTLTLAHGDITATTKTENAGAEKAKLLPTDTGIVVNDFLTSYFSPIVDYNFTADVETEFDRIAQGQRQWNEQIAAFYSKFHPTVEEVSQMRLEHKVGERVLGTDPDTGRPVSVKIGRFGPVAQIGAAGEDERPRFAPLLKGQTIQDITLEQALKLFQLPRLLGQYEDKDITAAIGRFGPYIKHGTSFVSIPKTLAPLTITLDEAIALIEKKRADDANRVVKTFDEDTEMQVLNGRFGVYISRGKANYKIPKGTDAATLTYQQCLDICADEANAPRKRAPRKRAAAKGK